jgi:hypothetical protein
MLTPAGNRISAFHLKPYHPLNGHQYQATSHATAGRNNLKRFSALPPAPKVAQALTGAIKLKL